jgi:hypothetical protein
MPYLILWDESMQILEVLILESVMTAIGFLILWHTAS